MRVLYQTEDDMIWQSLEEATEHESKLSEEFALRNMLTGYNEYLTAFCSDEAAVVQVNNVLSWLLDNGLTIIKQEN